MKRMKTPILTVSAAAIFTLALAGCSTKQPTPQEEAAPQLYAGSVKCLKKYIDSVRKAPDSAAVHRLMSEFQESLTKLNFDFPPNTDLSIGEDENDTLFRLTADLLELKETRLRGFSRRDTDSVAVQHHEITAVTNNIPSQKSKP